jgi:hypothetical protein
MRHLPAIARSPLAVAYWLLAILLTASCQKAHPPTTAEVVIVSAQSLPSAPADAAWQTAPEHVAKLILQDLVEPRLLKPSVPEVRVRAIASASEVAFRLEWADATKDDLPGPAKFSDGCAIQLPAKVEPNVPAPQMGEPGRPVEIAYWNATWQASADGRGDSIKDIYPNASIDHYPFEAAPLQKDPAAQREMTARYSPARALGNAVAGPRQTPVQDLVAEGPGTLTPAQTTTSKGRGKRTANGWAVVITRRLPQTASAQLRSQIAFAVWDGSQQEVGARKMRTGWVPLAMQK